VQERVEAARGRIGRVRGFGVVREREARERETNNERLLSFHQGPRHARIAQVPATAFATYRAPTRFYDDPAEIC
jgi:hypothetical protein